ncbi:MAG: integrase arm-type DNA-binding domain-containing protein [Methylococcales bacterium]
MALTDTKIRTTNTTGKRFKLYDSRGLYLEVTPTGSKRWRFKYRYDNKEKLLSLGIYPEVSLKKARLRRDEARELLAEGIDPSVHRKDAENKKTELNKNTFEAVAREWHTKQSKKWSTGHSEKTLAWLEKNIIPWLGNRPVSEIEAPELLEVLRKVEARGALDTAHRLRAVCGQVFRYAIATGKAKRDITADLKGALTPRDLEHYASITDPKEIGALMRAIDGYSGSFVTRCALKLAPLFFVRPGELRHAEWSDIDLEAGEWIIPAEKMKMKRIHIIPLSTQAVAILKEIQPLTGHARYVFHSERTNTRPMSENTINAALRRLGYSKEQMTGHGFRSMASIRLNEQGFNVDWIELQLAHSEGNSVRDAYNYAQYLPERKQMMQWYSDYLCRLRDGAEIIPFKKAE